MDYEVKLLRSERTRYWEHRPPLGWKMSTPLPNSVGRCKFTLLSCGGMCERGGNCASVDCRTCFVPERCSHTVQASEEDIEACNAVEESLKKTVKDAEARIDKMEKKNRKKGQKKAQDEPESEEATETPEEGENSEDEPHGGETKG